MIFPINIADFIFKDGVHVMSIQDVMNLKRLNVAEAPKLDDSPYLSQNVYNGKETEPNPILKETVLTS